MTADTATPLFEEHRPVLMGIAYRMLGRVADAEDVVQDAWLRWSAADRTDVREPRGFLVRITTRLALDRLRRIKARGETYVAPDVRLVGDSGGKARAPLWVLDGADHVGRFFVGVAGKGLPDVSVRTVELNGGPAVLVLSGGKPDTVVQIDADGDRIRTVYVVRNPDKLAALTALP
ncbi:sigma factor [Streptomyces cellulosae]